MVAFPTSLDTLTNPTASSTLTAVPHATQHADINDAVEAIEAKLGIDSSAVNTSIDYLLKNVNSLNPGHKHNASNILMTTLVGTPTYTTQNDFNNSFGSAGRKTGGVGSDAGSSKVAVTGGTGFIKASDDDNAQLLPFDWAAPADITIPANSSRYIGVEYNAGSPQVVSRTTSTWDYDTDFPLLRVVNDTINGAEELYIANTQWWVTDGMTNVIQAIRSFGLVRRDEYVGGMMLSATGTRNIAVSAGRIWAALNDTAFDGLDTAVTGTVEGYWYKAGSGWQSSDLTQWSKTQWNDVSQTTLQTIDNNKYCNVWVYGEMNATGITIALLYPQAQYNSAAEAESKSAPDNVPAHISQLGMLLGRFIIKQNVDAPVSTQSVFTTKFGTTVVTSHPNLGTLGWTSCGHTGTASTIAGFAAATGAAAEYTLSGSGTVLATNNSPVFTTPTLGAATGTTGLFGATANLTDWPTARIVGSQADSAHSYTGNIGIIGEAVAAASDTGTGVGGVAVTNGANESRGVTGVGKVGATGDTAKANGVYGYVNGIHAGGDNIGVRGSAINGANNYAFYGENGKIYSSGDIELGHLTDTTIHRVSAGVISVEGKTILTTDNIEDSIVDGHTTVAPSGNAVFDALALKAPLSGPTFTGTVTLPKTIEIQDTSADHQYVLAVNELTADRTITLPLLTGTDTFVFQAHTQTLTNKRITRRVASTTDDATAVIDCDAYDDYYLTAIANATEISITGTPTVGQTIFIGLKDAGVTKNLTWTGITALGVTLPTATTAGKQHIIGLKYIGSTWYATAVGVEA